MLAYKTNTTELAPALAESWTVASDGGAIDLKLRPNVKFHDGSTLDAETVKASIDRTKALGKGGAFFLQALKEVQVVDPMTVRLVGSQPSVSLLYGLPKVYITGKAHLADADQGAAYFATNINGSGPFKLARWNKGQQIVFDRHADYWGGWSGPHVDQLIEQVVPAAGHPATLARARGRTPGRPADHRHHAGSKRDRQQAGVRMVETPAMRVTVISMNTQKGPLADVRLRKALQAAFDYQGMLQIYQGLRRGPEQPAAKGLHRCLRRRAAAVQAGPRAGQETAGRGRAMPTGRRT